MVITASAISLAGESGHGSHDAHGQEAEFHSGRAVEIAATILFALAVIHTFTVTRFRSLAKRFEEGTVMENLCHLLGEVEAVFLVWSFALVATITACQGWSSSVAYVEGRNYTEPTFVFVIMTIAATRPVIDVVDQLIRSIARLLPLPASTSFFCSALIVGPLLGSFVTEPAAMTVTALVMKRQFFDRGISRKFMYAILGVLFVNVSIGGTLTHFAAPPVLMVAGTWGWDMQHMISNFGWKAAVAVTVNTLLLTYCFRKHLRSLQPLEDSGARNGSAAEMTSPFWVVMVHLAFLAFTVLTAHHSKLFLGGFLFFLGFVAVAKEYQEKLELKQSLLVGGFLAGLVTLGGLQSWWLQPLLASLSELPLYLGATALTAVTDNAALTYLGSLVEGLSDPIKYALVAGAVTGGGLTVIANAPNPAGYSILNSSFENDGGKGQGISPIGLLLGALVPTLVALVCFWFLPNL